MSILSIKQGSKSFGERIVLESVSFSLAYGDRVGLVGANGSGKSTLLKILAGEMELSLGTVLLAPSITLGYLPQAFEPKGNLTITALLEDATKEIQEMHVTIDRQTDLMTKLSDDPHALERVLSEYGDLQARFEHRGGYDLPHRVDAVLQGLRLASIDRERPVSSLSGGEQVRLGLAAVLIQSPDLLLLDEPTNHLDREALEWLEQYLAAFSGALMVVSHDRLFLNLTVNQIIEIDEYSHRAKRYSGNYDMYQRQKALERAQWEERYATQQAQIQELKQRIQTAHQHVGHNRPPKDNNKMAYKRHRAKVERTVGRNIQSAEVELVRIQENAVPRPPKPLCFDANFEWVASHHAVAVTCSEVSYVLPNGRHLFEEVRFTLGRSERMLIVGPNGAGKTTLLNVVAGVRPPSTGMVLRPAGTRIGYVPQDLIWPDPVRTVLEEFRSEHVAKGQRRSVEQSRHQSASSVNGDEESTQERSRVYEECREAAIAQLLSYELFRYEEFDLPCAALSPGQHRKLRIAKLLVSGANLLVLDEPTNHLSFAVLEEFERALTVFPGAIVAVSHDRRFIERFQGEVWTLNSGRLAQT